MKLGTLNTDNRDGALVVVDKLLTHYVEVPDIAATLQFALDHWENVAPQLEDVYQYLNEGKCASNPFDPALLAAPLPRAYQWLDGSAYLSHVERVRKARGAELPPGFLKDPLMYQGASDHFLAAQAPINAESEDWGIDFEAEVGVITDDVEMGTDKEDAKGHIKLLVLINDVSLRNLIPAELSKGFGFIHGKPASTLSPVAVTLDELGHEWKDSKLHLPLFVFLNQILFGQADAGADMQFDFAQLISHAAKTRRLSAGTILGSGTVSNYDRSVGHSCIVEKRMVETVEKGAPITGFLNFGDRVRIEMYDQAGLSIFGAIDQVVEPWP